MEREISVMRLGSDLLHPLLISAYSGLLTSGSCLARVGEAWDAPPQCPGSQIPGRAWKYTEVPRVFCSSSYLGSFSHQLPHSLNHTSHLICLKAPPSFISFISYQRRNRLRSRNPESSLVSY